MTATPPESSNGGEKEPRSPGYRRAPPASHPTAVSSVYSDPGYSYHVHYGNSAVDGGDDRGGGYNSHVDYINSYSSPRDSYAEECWPQEGCCGSYQGGSGSGLGGLSGDDLELPIVLGALALGGLALYFLRMAITINIKGRRRRRRWSSDNDLDQKTADTVLNFLWSGKAAIIRCRMLYVQKGRRGVWQKLSLLPSYKLHELLFGFVSPTGGVGISQWEKIMYAISYLNRIENRYEKPPPPPLLPHLSNVNPWPLLS